MIKYLFFPLFLVISIIHVNAETPLKTKIEKVTVFRSGAQIIRTAKVPLKTGSNTIVLGNLPSGFDESTIQVRLVSRAEIISVAFRNNFNNDFESNPTYKHWKTQLEGLIGKKEDESVILDTWKEEESLLLSNKKVGGENGGLSPEQLTKTADIYRTRLLSVKQKVLDSKRKITELEKEIIKLQSTINEWTGKNRTTNNGEVIVEVLAGNNAEDVVELSYIDNRAAWVTGFDLRLETLQKPLNLVNKGRITQSTGEDWENVKVVLSTGNPRLNTTAPQLQPWFLYYLQDYYAANQNNAYSKVQAQARPGNVRMSEDVATDEVSVVENRENITFMEYSLPNKINIPSDNKPHEVKLQEAEINANYRYESIPKLDSRVYLLAIIPEWNQYNFSSGEVKLYFEGTYIGTSYINASDVSDTLEVSLGPDIAIPTKREKLKDFRKTSFFSSKKQLQNGWEITVKNNKSTDIDLTLKDQIPLSSDNQMEIEVEDLSGGKLNKETGEVEWKVTLKPGEQLKKRIIYKVTIPKDKRVSLF